MAIDYIICPHCTLEAPKGIRSCAGCDSRVQYGAPFGLFVLFVLIILALAAAVHLCFRSTPLLVIGIGTAVLDSLWLLAAVTFHTRVVFKRPRQTE